MDKWVVDPETGEGSLVPMTPEEEADVLAHQAGHAKQQAAQHHAMAEDAERLGIVAERAATDPAYAALAELTLGRKGL